MAESVSRTETSLNGRRTGNGVSGVIQWYDAHASCNSRVQVEAADISLPHLALVELITRCTNIRAK